MVIWLRWLTGSNSGVKLPQLSFPRPHTVAMFQLLPTGCDKHLDECEIHSRPRVCSFTSEMVADFTRISAERQRFFTPRDTKSTDFKPALSSSIVHRSRTYLTWESCVMYVLQPQKVRWGFPPSREIPAHTIRLLCKWSSIMAESSLSS